MISCQNRKQEREKYLNKKFSLSNTTKVRIEKEIYNLSKITLGIYKKIKEIGNATIINIIIDSKILPMEKNQDEKLIKDKENLEIKFLEDEKAEKNSNLSIILEEKFDKFSISNDNSLNNYSLPNHINFVIILDCTFPKFAPKLLLKTNISFPSLVDGRNLICEICPNWNPENIPIYEIINKIPDMILKIKSSKTTHLYGKFEIGALYEMNNFSNMSVNSFQCIYEKEDSCEKKTIKNNSKSKIKQIENKSIETLIILTDDSLLMFSNVENENSVKKLIFWCFLFSIIDMQINKIEKILILRLFNDLKNSEKKIKLTIENILFFKEAIVKRISNLKIRIESHNISKGISYEERLTDRDINNMLIDELIENFEKFQNKLNNQQYSFYNVNSFFNITKKIVEYLSARNDERHLIYLQRMKKILEREEVKKILYGND